MSRNASKQPVIVFRMLQQAQGAATATAVPFKTFNPDTVTFPLSTQEMWDNFMGSPSAYFVFAVPQDVPLGASATPADFNASTSGYLRSIWNGTATGSGAGTLTGPDANGFYTVTLTGVTIPDNAVMLTGGIGYSYGLKATMPLTQTNLANYPVTPATGSGLTASMPNKTGGLIVITPNVQKVATGYTGRRPIVEDARCNKCHQELGTFTTDAFHGGQRNDGTTCAWCHTPNQNTSGWSGDSTSYIHAIHAGAARTVPFTWHATSATENFSDVKYPGVLKDCETCHLPGTIDFSATASASAIANRQYRTVATGTLASASTSAFTYSPYITQDFNYGSGFSFSAATGVTTEAAATTLVNSPIATQCFACHDSTVERAHMEITGSASIYSPRSVALGKVETCMVCHGPGHIADIKVMHSK